MFPDEILFRFLSDVEFGTAFGVYVCVALPPKSILTILYVAGLAISPFAVDDPAEGD